MQAAAGCFGLVCGYFRSATAVVELEPAGVVLQTLMRDGSALLLHFSQSIRARQYGTCQEAFFDRGASGIRLSVWYDHKCS